MRIEIEAETEDEFLAAYDPLSYPPMAVTAEVALFTMREGRLCLLLIERRGHPHQGRHALLVEPVGQIAAIASVDGEDFRGEIAHERAILRLSRPDSSRGTNLGSRRLRRVFHRGEIITASVGLRQIIRGLVWFWG